ncbi:oligogalacturonate lyase family protein (plasmid) [Telmatobacter bradus]|uniref:oligogalacturonate lyase family protein n=1 Tax=Telmatobacter bradus TaxID=474953 RepID=UPI003B4344B7
MNNIFASSARFRINLFWLVCLVAAQAQAMSSRRAASEIPSHSWIDQATGHRIIQLSEQPGSRGLYFNNNAFTPDGKQMVYFAEDGIYVVDMATFKSHLLASGSIRAIVMARRSSAVYYMKHNDQGVYKANISTGELQRLGVLPSKATINTINADDTLLAGAYIDTSDPNFTIPTVADGIKNSKKALERVRFDSHPPTILFTFNIQTAAVSAILHTNNWLNHVLFSPTDSSLLMYCHEGPWNEVDRIWTIHADGSGNQTLHKRSLDMAKETAGHEFWDRDGKTIWYDLQTPKGQAFYLAGYNTATGERQRYQMDRDQWSIHFNGDLESGVFAGDGASEYMAASSSNGQWIQLYHLYGGAKNERGKVRFKEGIVESEQLVDLSKHDYNVEPNIQISPDHKYVIFTSSMLGPTYVFAVEIARADRAKGAARKHAFEPSSWTTGSNTAQATIQVVDSSNTPMSNALVIVKSLDTGAQVGQYLTGQDGTTQQISLDKDLHRFTIACPNNACSTTIREMFTAPSQNKITLHANTPSAIVASAAVAEEKRADKMVIVLQDANRNSVPQAPFLVRTSDAIKEAWYKTSMNGAAAVKLPADPSVVTFFVNWKHYAYKFSSSCGTTTSDDPEVIGCIQTGSTATVILPAR